MFSSLVISCTKFNAPWRPNETLLGTFKQTILRGPIGFISDRYCKSRGLLTISFDLSAKIVPFYEPLRRPIFTINFLFSGRKSLAV